MSQAIQTAAQVQTAASTVRWRTDCLVFLAYRGFGMRELPLHKARRMKAMSMQAEFVAKMETQMKKWDADVDALAVKGEKESAKVRAAYHEQIKQLRANREKAQQTFQKFRVASESASAQLQLGMEAAWESMQKALKKVSTDLKG
jgi:hypothetical protein